MAKPIVKQEPTRSVVVRVTMSQYDNIVKACKTRKQTISQFVRNAISAAGAKHGK